MLLKSPTSFHYPVTVKKLLRNEGDKIPKFAPLFSYVYTDKVIEHNIWHQETVVVKEMPAEYKAEKEGALTKWSIQEGMTLKGPGIPLVEITEECAHDVQWGGMCANCGKDMSEVDFNTTVRDFDRANVVRTHGTTALKISQDLAVRTEEDAKRRLLSSKKLSLVVDLDCTVIHATVDPTVGDWMRDPENPNYGVVQNVRSFELDDNGPGARKCLYYIKLRPGLKKFLEQIAQLYELHIYTMGTRAYADQIAKIVDPDRKVFGDRILSRDESGSVHYKTLQRIFPIDTKMVVIIDDRGDVWNWIPNLIKVTPYDFFVGIGDINASFLPKKPVPAKEAPAPLLPPPRPATLPPSSVEYVERPQEPQDGNKDPAEPAESVEETESKPKEADQPESPVTPVGALEQQIVAMSHRDDPQKMKDQAIEQAEAVAAQLEDRPLLQKQKLLDEADEKADQNGQTGVENAQDAHQHRHNLLHDDDEELIHLEQSLRRVHQAFYDTYEQQRTGSQGGRVAELRPGKSPKKRAVDDLDVVPDIGYIMPEIKRDVLKGISIVFSGVVPLGMNIFESDIAVWAKSFGAHISEKLTKRTTHVVAARNRRTAKVRQAARHPQIKIVTTGWLYECFTKWEKANEEPHIIHVEPDEHGSQSQTSPLEELDEGTVLSSSEEDAAMTTDGELGDPTEDEELADLAPTSPVDESAIRGKAEDWEAMEDELEEFLASDSEDDSTDADEDSDASQSDRSTLGIHTKRKHDGDSESEEDVKLVSVAGGSKLQRRKRQAMERTTSLTNMAVADKSSGLPSPDTTGPEEEQDGETDNAMQDQAVPDDDADEDADLEAEMLKELEREEEEDGDDYDHANEVEA